MTDAGLSFIRNDQLPTAPTKYRGDIMKTALKTVRNYFCYCGIEKDEYNALKKDAYVSNFEVWRILHVLMAAVFAVLSVGSLFSDLMKVNGIFYFSALIYSLIAVGYFFFARKDSLIAQFIIYLSISMLFLFAGFVSQNKPDTPAITFIAFLLITPMFMIDKPYFMTIELITASVVFLIWMYYAEPYDVWKFEMYNVIIFTVVGIFLHIIANSIRIKEFVLRRSLSIQKDMDELTGIKNKGALTCEINAYLADETTDKGIMLLLDVDKFKSINDTFGHDVGDHVIRQIGAFLKDRFTDRGIAGRFGGDEFIVFIKGTDDPDTAYRIAVEMIKGIAESVVLPDRGDKVSVSVGVAVYTGAEKNYSEILKKADIALYQSKADPINRFFIYE